MRAPTLVVSLTRPNTYRGIGLAVAAAPHGALILVEPGRYDGHVVVRAKAVTIRAGVPGAVTVENRDAAPTVYCEGADVALEGLVLRTWSSDAPATVSVVGGRWSVEL
ncbi:hypothetical protein [Micromonospora sp. NPDC005203]|uniref:hypothetical protein n=1 Tax=Micromonospora sp. NPDC005203 TaxID=3364226 RepID=UPI003692089A